MTQFYIIDAVRTPRGKAKDDGALATMAPADLLGRCITALDERTANDGQKKLASNASSMTVGCVGQVGAQGGHIALVTKALANLNRQMTTCTLNNYCVSGLSAVGHAMGRLALGQDEVSLAGGVESMSSVPFMADKATYYTDPATSSRAGYVPVAVSAELLANVQDVERATLDEMAMRSQARAAESDQNASLQKSRIPIFDDEGTLLLDRDETIRALDADKLKALNPAFDKLNTMFESTVRSRLSDVEVIVPVQTIAHAPPMCDGASMLLLGTMASAKKHGLTPRARIRAYAETSADSTLGLTAGLDAFDKVLEEAGWNAKDVDAF